MSSLADLYQEIIIEHNQNPVGFGALGEPSHSARGHNPLCGDDLSVQLIIDDGTVVAACFKGDSCAISMASASILMKHLQGATVDDATKMINGFFKHFEDDVSHGLETIESDNEIEALVGVKSFPARIKCALLPWKTVQAAMQCTHSESIEVSTE